MSAERTSMLAPWMLVALVGLGGLLGSLARWGLSTRITQWAASRPGSLGAFPVGTLTVNLLGCLLIGLLAGLAVRSEGFSPALRLFLLTGVLGGFTTFSAFGLETLQLLSQRQWPLALAYVGASVVLGLLAVAAGLWLGGGPAAFKPL